jgi:fimbrial chaperone protein
MRVHGLAALLGLSLLTTVSHAFTIIPMSATFQPSGKGAAQVFRVENESSNRVAFQISVLTRELDEHGKETNRPAPDLFTVFPPQGAIPPGQSQSVRLVWRGPTNPERELAFRLVAEELPVNFTQEVGKVQIKVLLRYMAALYVTPRNARPSLQVGNVTRTDTNTYVLSVTNSGKMHQNLMKPRLALTDAQGRRRDVPAEALRSVESENVLAGSTRRFVLTLPAEFTESSYKADLAADE